MGKRTDLTRGANGKAWLPLIIAGQQFFKSWLPAVEEFNQPFGILLRHTRPLAGRLETCPVKGVKRLILYAEFCRPVQMAQFVIKILPIAGEAIKPADQGCELKLFSLRQRPQSRPASPAASAHSIAS